MSSCVVFTPNGTAGSTTTRAPRSHARTGGANRHRLRLNRVGGVREMIVVRFRRSPREDRDVVRRRVHRLPGCFRQDVRSCHAAW